jgi:hypothetical protein
VAIVVDLSNKEKCARDNDRLLYEAPPPLPGRGGREVRLGEKRYAVQVSTSASLSINYNNVEQRLNAGYKIINLKSEIIHSYGRCF